MKYKNKKNPPKWFYILLIVIPISFFIVFEIFLRVINYGNDYKVFKQVSDYYPDKLFINPDLPSKYFSGLKKGPGVIPDAFDKIKKENSYRIFVLGGSSTAGWPYVPNASFPRILKRKLELLYPGNKIEVINCGVSAINSYTIRDIIPAITEQEPDLILIYAGHNEYYGALGAASTVSLGRSRTIVNLYLGFQKFKTIQFITNIISGITGIFSPDKEKLQNPQGETLMSRMIGESLIPLNSKLFHSGIEQFKGNMTDILTLLKDKNIPVIIGTLTCNLRDLKPFISVSNENFLPADSVYKNALIELNSGNTEKAKELFLYAKELDALRFRAPIKLNEIINELAEKFNYSMVDIDSIFKSLSPDGIVGYNLTVDHLHPNLEGYKIISESFYKKMEEFDLLPRGNRNDITESQADSILKVNFPFTPLDSTISYMKIIQLTGAYPFVPKSQSNILIKNFKVKNFIDSTAVNIINNDIFWEVGHGNVAHWYYKNGDYVSFMKEMDAIIAERPFFDIPYENTINKLIEVQLFDEALPYLKKLHILKPSFFSNKWLGQIYLQNQRYSDAMKYLEEAVKFNDNDYQVWYNLSGAYYFNKEFIKSLNAIERSLKLNPNNPLAQNLYLQLKKNVFE